MTSESSHTRNWLVMTAVGVGSLLGSIDGSIVNVALPTIGRDLKSEVATAEWVTTIYVLMACGLLLTFGRIGDMRGYKPIYVLGLATFVASSALCGLAPNIATLILFRAVQGVGGSMLISIGPGILTVTFPPSQRGKVLGLQALMIYVGGTLGPVLGGVLTDALSWRAIFYVNVPIGLVALVLSAKYIPRAALAKQSERFDLPGAALIMAMCSLLLIVLDQGHAYGWTSPYIVTMFAADVLLLIAFLLIESRTRSPLLDLSLFRVPAFSLAGASAICNYIGFFASIFLMPFYLIQGRGLSSSSAGLIVAVQSLLMALAAPVAGAISDRIGTRLPATVGMAVLAVSMYMLSFLGPASSLMYIGIAMGASGLGIGSFVPPNNSAMMGSAPKHRQGIAGGVVATFRYTGMMLGYGLSGAIFTSFIRVHTQAAFYGGIRVSFLVASAVSCMGCIASAARK